MPGQKRTQFMHIDLLSLKLTNGWGKISTNTALIISVVQFLECLEQSLGEDDKMNLTNLECGLWRDVLFITKVNWFQVLFAKSKIS